MKRFIAVIFFVSMVFGTISASSPLRIVSLAPSLTKSIVQVGAHENLVGCTNYCTIDKKTTVKIVASAVQVYIEKVVALKPDIVLATDLTDPETIKTLQKFGIEVKVIHSATSFDQLCDQFIAIGTMVDRKLQAEKIIAESKLRMGELTKRFNADRKQKMFFQIGAQPLFTVLSNTFMNDFITLAGGENIAKNMTSGTITREFVLASNPDVIIITSMGITGAEEKKIWESYKTVSAVKSHKILIVDADLACSPTPIDFVMTFESIANFLNQTKP